MTSRLLRSQVVRDPQCDAVVSWNGILVDRVALVRRGQGGRRIVAEGPAPGDNGREAAVIALVRNGQIMKLDLETLARPVEVDELHRENR